MFRYLQMKQSIAFLFFLVILFLIVPASSSAKPVHAEIFPKKISPGDAFIIRVTGVENGRPVSACFGKAEISFGNCGEGCYLAIWAVDIQTRPKAYNVKVTAGKNKIRLKLHVKKKKFPELCLSLPDEKVTPSPDDLKRVEDENKKLAEIFQSVSEGLWEGNFILPLENEISTVFGTKRVMNEKWTSVHRGMDIRGKEGEQVRASNSGKVVLSEELFYGGNTIVIDHGMGIFSIYMHLSGFNVKSGDIVSKGDAIGLVGSSGRSTGPHLHFGVKVAGINVNPASLMKLQL
jgi:murein DD-endopeptidase MepM/ murein hydrolase activator NlpD